MKYTSILVFSAYLYAFFTPFLVSAFQDSMGSDVRDGIGITPVRLNEKVNTKYDEIDPFISPDGQTLYFTRRFHPDNFGGPSDPGDIWVSTKRTDGTWTTAVNAGAQINNRNYNKVAGVSKDGQSIWLVGVYKNQKSKFENLRGISKSTKSIAGQWSPPIPERIQYFNNKSKEISAHVDPSGEFMLLSIQSYESEGVEDIYISFRSKNSSYEWTQPKNLGSGINTKFQEKTPFLSRDGISLFFTSNGYQTKGGSDIFLSRRIGDGWDKWSKPTNISSVNTRGVDLGFIFSSAGEAYYSSTFASKGYGDIYYVKWEIEEDLNPNQIVRKSDSLEQIVHIKDDIIKKKEEEVIEVNDNQNDLADQSIAISQPEEPKKLEVSAKDQIVKGQLTNSQTGKAIQNAVVQLKMANQEDAILLSTNNSGIYEGVLPITADLISLTINQKGYLIVEKTFSITENPSELNCILEPLDLGRTIALPAVLFQRGTSILLKDSYPQLDQMVKTLLGNESLKIQLRGHTDGIGSGNANMILSQKRVETIKDYMVEKGISQDRIEGKGFGGTQPINSRKDEESRRLNRRVEFKILSI